MSTEEAKQANAHVFSQNELALLIIGLRGTIVIKGVDLMMMQNRLLEQFKKELLDRFGTYLEDLDAEDLEFEAEIFFGSAEGAAAGQRALEAAGFDLEPRPGHAEDNHQTVWMMAYGACPGDADTPEIIQNLEALIKPHGGMIWELGPIGPEGESAPPRFYEMMKHAVFRRTNLYPLQFEPGRSDD